MSMGAAALFEMLQRVGGPIVQAITASPAGGTLLSTDRHGSFLDVMLHCCAAGASDIVNVLQTNRAEPRIAITDGFQLFASRSELAGVTKSAPAQTTSLDRIGLLLQKVIVIALDGEGVRDKAWRGAAALIQRDRPIFVAYARNDRSALAELVDQGYILKSFGYWGYPKLSTIFVMAIPQEKADHLLGVDAPMIAPPPALLSPGAPGVSPIRAVPQTLFEAREFEIESGFHPLEQDDFGSWIWSGPSREGRVILPCSWLGAVKLLVSVVNVADEGNPREIHFRVNDKEAPCKWIDGGAELSAFIGPEEFGGAIMLSVIASRVSYPNDMDDRRLGCCINKIEVNWC